MENGLERSIWESCFSQSEKIGKTNIFSRSEKQLHLIAERKVPKDKHLFAERKATLKDKPKEASFRSAKDDTLQMRHS